MKLLKFDTFSFFLSILFCIIIYFFYREVFENNLKNQFILFLLPLIWPGIAHGSLDLEIAKKLNLVNNVTKLSLFLLSYILLIALFICIWMWSSNLGLLIFFLISIYHFGSSDSLLYDNKTLYKLEIFIRGCLPLSLPSYFYKNNVIEILNYLFIDSFFIEKILFILNIALLLCLIIFLIITLINLRSKLLEGIYVIFFIDVVLIVICFIIFEPFVSFCLYFCFFHSLRHLINEKESLGFSLSKTIIKTLPFTIIATLTFFLTYLNFNFNNVDLKFLPLLFIGLASLTVPHMILISFSKIINKPF